MALRLPCRSLMLVGLLGIIGSALAAPNQPPTVSITGPAGGSAYVAPAQITITANAADSDGSVTQVEFFQGSTLIGADATAPYGVQWNNVPAGSYSLTAKATDNGGKSTVSTSVNVMVNNPPLVAPFRFDYDSLGRLVGMGSSGGAAATYQYRYDSVGNTVAIDEFSSGQVAILAFNPGSGGVGSSVTINGVGFSSVVSENVVRFNGVVATVTSATSTQLAVLVPSGASTGNISVTTPAGVATSTTSFSVVLAPSINSFTPAMGLAGSSIFIEGDNFSPTILANTVRLNSHLAHVVSATGTALTAIVPKSTGSGRISVSTANGTSISSSDFIVPPGIYTAGDIEIYQRMSIGQTTSLSITVPYKIGLMLFDGVAGKRISLNVPGSSPNRVVSIRDPDGILLESDSYLYGQFFDALILPGTGTYTIVIDPTSTNTGTVTLTLYDLPPDVTGSITAGGSPVTVTTTVPGQKAIVTFEGTAGQRISLNVPGSSPSRQVSIRNPNGTLLESDSYYYGQFFDALTLPSTGTYTIVLDPVNTETGSMTLTLYNVPPDVSGSVSVNGSSFSTSITAPGQNARITFAGTAGSSVTVRATGNTMGSMTVRLLAPDGSILKSNSSSSSSFSLSAQTLGASGTYTVLVDPIGANVGSVNIAVTSP